MRFYFSDSSSKTIRNIVVLLLFLWLTELHSMLWYLFPEQLNKPLNLFLSSSYRLHGQWRGAISFEMWVKAFFDSFLPFAGFTIASYYVINKKISIALRWIGIYYILDLFWFIWDYKSHAEYFYCLLGVTTIIFILLIVKHRQKRGLIIDIEKGMDHESEK